jgi:hypothetical protein
VREEEGEGGEREKFKGFFSFFFSFLDGKG